MSYTYAADWADDAAVLDPSLEDQALEAIEEVAGGPVLCGWFALCMNQATTTIHHPVLDYVPCCDRCAAKVAALS